MHFSRRTFGIYFLELAFSRFVQYITSQAIPKLVRDLCRKFRVLLSPQQSGSPHLTCTLRASRLYYLSTLEYRTPASLPGSVWTLHFINRGSIIVVNIYDDIIRNIIIRYRAQCKTIDSCCVRGTSNHSETFRTLVV